MKTFQNAFYFRDTGYLLLVLIYILVIWVHLCNIFICY